MIDTLKKLDRKFLIIVGCIIILPILLIIFLAIIQGCSNKKMNYSSYEKKMVTAAQKYFKDNNLLPMSESDTRTVKLEKLVEDKYIKSTKKALKDETCEGSVTVRRNGISIDENNEGYLNYIYDLKCEDYSTVHLIDKLKENVVTSDSGLYAYDGGYIFKGDKPNNYITFYDNNYRIMSIDKNGIIKLIKETAEPTSRIWDNKYNTEVNYSYGKTIYKDSSILNSLINDYKNRKKINDSARSHVVAYDSCIGKRKSTDYTISKELDCSEVLEKQVISMINTSDYAMASLDSECNSVKSRSCNNYNYLKNVVLSTWTMNSILDNTYQAIYISGGILNFDNANLYNEYNIVIYIDGNELYTTGIGTSTNPYIIK